MVTKEWGWDIIGASVGFDLDKLKRKLVEIRMRVAVFSSRPLH